MCAQVGVFPSTTQTAATSNSAYNTANTFIVGETDWGPVGTPVACLSLANAASSFGTPTNSGNPYSSRTATDANVLDAVDTIAQEDGSATPTMYVSRVVGPAPTSATIVLQDGSSATALTVTAQYVGVGGNGILVAVANATTSYVVTLYDTLGNVLAVSPSLTSNAAGVTWFATTGLATAVAGAGALPKTLSATAMSGGSDNRGSATITNWQNALLAFSPGLGPGQTLAPGQTNTTLSGIWSALGTHAIGNNRVALLDCDDDQTVATITTDIGTFGTSSVASYCGFWAGNRQIPGVVAGTTRNVPPSPVIAGLCARVDQTGNQNLAAAGEGYPLYYAKTPTSIVSGTYDTYSLNDLYSLNSIGVNTFQNVFGTPQNYGFVATVLPSTDPVYWQFNHARLRMAIVAQAQQIGQPFVFAQLDGQGSTANQFGSALTAMLKTYYQAGALWAYVVDVGPTVNTPATVAAGQLLAQIGLQFANFAQAVYILINVSPLTQTLVP